MRTSSRITKGNYGSMEFYNELLERRKAKGYPVSIKLNFVGEMPTGEISQYLLNWRRHEERGSESIDEG